MKKIKIEKYQCEYCNNIFDSQSDCKHHEYEQHLCPICQHSYYVYGCELNCTLLNNHKKCQFVQKQNEEIKQKIDDLIDEICQIFVSSFTSQFVGSSNQVIADQLLKRMLNKKRYKLLIQNNVDYNQLKEKIVEKLSSIFKPIQKNNDITNN